MQVSALTPAWTPIRERGIPQLTGQRLAYMTDPHRFKVVAAGRRSAKTLIAKRRLVLALTDHLDIPIAEQPPWFREAWRYFFAAPTQDQAVEIGFSDLLALTPPEWIAQVYRGSKPVIKTIWNSELHIIGMDEARRIEGQPWNGGVLDEFPDMKVQAWSENIVPVLADRNAWLIILGVPDYSKPNNKVFKELFDKGQCNDPEWKSYTWFSSEVLDDDALAMMRGSMLSHIFKQEAEASWDAPPAGGLFNPAWWKTLKPEVWAEFPIASYKWARGWDPAGGQSKGSDYSSGGLVGHPRDKSKDKRIIIADITRGQWSPGVRNSMMAATAVRDTDRQRDFSPTNLFWRSRTPDMNRSIAEDEEISKHAFWPITERGRKYQRAQRLAVQAEAGNVWLAPGPWNAEFILEASQFKDEDSDDVRKDDMVDCVCLSDSYLIKWN